MVVVVSVRGYPSAEVQSVYSTAPANRVEDTRGGGVGVGAYPTAEMQSVYSSNSADYAYYMLNLYANKYLIII